MSSIDSAVVQARRAAAAAPVAPRPIVPNHVRVAVATEHSTRRFHGLLNEPYQVRFYERCDRVEVRGIPPSMEERACHVWVEQPGNQPFHLILIGKRIFNLLPSDKKVDRDAQEALACAVYRHESAHGRHTTKDRAALTRAETEARIDHPTWNAGEDVRIESHERSESGRRLGWVGVERIGAVDLQRPAQYVTIHRHFEDDVAAAERYLGEQGVPPAEVEITTDAVRALRAAADSCAVPGIMRSFYDRIRASRESPASPPEQAPEQPDQAKSASDQPESGESGESEPQDGDGGSDDGEPGDSDDESGSQPGDEASESGAGASGSDDEQSPSPSGDNAGGAEGTGGDGSESGDAASPSGDAGGQAGAGSDETSSPADAKPDAADNGPEAADSGDESAASGTGSDADGSTSGAQGEKPAGDHDGQDAGDSSPEGADGNAADGADEEGTATSGSSAGEPGDDAGTSIDQDGTESGTEAAKATEGDSKGEAEGEGEDEAEGNTGNAGKAGESEQDGEDASSDGAAPKQEGPATDQDGELAEPTGDERNGPPGTSSEVAEGDPAGTSTTGTSGTVGTAGHPAPIPVHEGTEPANPFEEIDESVLRQIMSDPKMLKAIMESSQDLNAESVQMPEPPPDYQSSAVREYSTSSPIVSGRCAEEAIDQKRVQQVAQVLAQALRGNRRNTFIEDPTEEIDLGRYLVRDRSCWLDTRENGNTEKSRLLLIVDCSGSMRAANTSPSGTPIGEARTLVAALNTIASRGLIEGHVALTKIGDGGAHYCQTMRLPVDPRIISRIPADGAGEGLDHTLDMVHDLAKQSDTVAMFTDGCTDAAIDKSQLHRDGVWLRGLYVGNTKPDPLSGTSIVENLKKYTDRAFIADSLEMLAIRLAADLRQKTAFRASGHGRW